MSWLDSAPAYQKRLCGYDQPGGFRSVASSYTGGLLTVGTEVRERRGSLMVGDVGRIARIVEASPDGMTDARCLVTWPGVPSRWVWGRRLMRVGRAR